MSRKCNCTANKNKSGSLKVREYCKDLILTNEQLRELMAIFLDNIKRGLGKETHANSSVKCFNTYVQELPTGKEKAKILGLDLGGTHFRILLIHLNMNASDIFSIYPLSEEIITGPGVKLFDYIAECLQSFMKEQNVYKEILPLGFTFSFALKMIGLTKGILEQWSKGFNCSGVIGNDVVQMLKDAVERRKDIQIEIYAILNDTTGTLMSCAWKNPNCKIGLIVGTGTNSCYLEKQSNVELFDAVNSGSGMVIINTESGGFGDDGSIDFVRTEIDKLVDVNTINPKQQIFEKMVSGMYLGEIVRLILLKCIKDGILFGGKDSRIIHNKESLITAHISEIESDPPGKFKNIRKILQELGLGHGTDEDCTNLRYICECVSHRSAHLVSVNVATLLNKMGHPNVTVGIDGSVYRLHPQFHNLMMEKITELVDPNVQFNLMLSEDGSGRGAAVVAAVAAAVVVSSAADRNQQ